MPGCNYADHLEAIPDLTRPALSQSNLEIARGSSAGTELVPRCAANRHSV